MYYKNKVLVVLIMILKEKELKLIKIYMYICDVYESSLKFYCQRFSNNNHPIFTDQELLTVYLFCGAYQQYFKIKDIHTFTKEYLLSWFPDLPSYQTFNYRLNLMPEAISELVRQLIHSFKSQDCDSMKSLVDSMPIITCAGKNKVGKVATEITSKGYCSTKNMYYFGIKLHAVAFRRKGTIPFPEMLILSAADENDSTVFKRECVGNLNNREIYADKIYSDIPFYKETKECKKLELFTPVKAIKGESPEITKREKAARDLFSTAVSKVRQPIEALFNWLNEKTNIQRAMKVRSTSGLLVHTMGKIAIALITLIFN